MSPGQICKHDWGEILYKITFPVKNFLSSLVIAQILSPKSIISLVTTHWPKIQKCFIPWRIYSLLPSLTQSWRDKQNKKQNKKDDVGLLDAIKKYKF